MQTRTRSLIFAALLTALLTVWAAPLPVAAQAVGQPTPSAGANTITPAEARRAIEVLQDDARRADALRTLKAIADAAPDAGGTPAQSPTLVDAITGARPAAATATAAATPLEANGLIARMLRSVGLWVDGLDDQLGQVQQATTALPAFFTDPDQGLTSAAGQRIVTHLLATLAIVFGLGLLLEWSLHYLLGKPRRALIEHADQADIADLIKLRKQQANTQRNPDAPRGQMPHPDGAATEKDSATAATRPVPDGVALVQTTRDGVERIEAVPVGVENAAGGPAASSEHTKDTARPAGTAATDLHADARAAAIQASKSAGKHWHTIKHLPYAAATLLLELLPLALFFVVAGLLLRWRVASDDPIHGAVSSFIYAYVTARVSMVVLRLLVSPKGHGLRILRVSDRVSRTLQTWIRHIVVLALLGIAIADAAQVLGTSLVIRMTFVKTVSLLVHICAVILILRLRRPVARAIRGADAAGPLALVRNWLARAWAVLAIALIAGIWVVWALGVEDGFPKLIHFVVVSGGVIVAARVIAVFALGAVGRIFQPRKTATESEPGPTRHGRLSERYFPLVRGLVTILISLCAVVALLQVWGLDALAWFARGTLGRSLAGAAATIFISIIVAIIVWEALHFAVDRRLARWQHQGDVVRAARLRTLLPMLRTVLFIVVVLVVGLTALNEIGINTTPLLAGASIIGVAVGFGSQKLVQDFITGIFLLMENAMRVGDWVTVAGVSGSVEYLSIRTVRLRGGDGSLYIVPFSSVSMVNNTNRGLGNAAIRVSISYESDVEQAMDELKQIGAALRQDPAFRDQILSDIEIWGVDAVDGSMVTLAGQIRCKDSGRWGVQREMNRRILERFRELGIAIANPRASLLLAAEGTPAAGLPPA